MQSTIDLTIDRIDRLDRHDYIITVGEKSLKGNVSVFHRKAQYYVPISAYHALKSKGVGKDDMIHLLYEFYPHGLEPVRTNNPYLHQGVATRVLTRIIDDSQTAGAKAIDLVAYDPNMKNLLEKFNFQPFLKDRYYRLL